MNIQLPPGIDIAAWIKRWDAMQDHYIPRRKERFDLMVRLIADTQPQPVRILDIGCGTGSLMLPILKKFPKATVYGIDFDATLLLLARERLKQYGNRGHLIEADLRDELWLSSVRVPVDAAVSATALHWLSPPNLARLYAQLADLIRPGGIFLNADHVRSKSDSIQKSWEQHRDLMRGNLGHTDEWEGFWQAYGQALKTDIKTYRRKLTEPWEGSEQGLPLEWHFNKLKASGFEVLDCFWRLDCDAIYGAIRK